MLAGEDHQRAVLGHMAFAAADRFFIKRRHGQIPVDRLEIAKAVIFQTVCDMIAPMRCAADRPDMPTLILLPAT